MSDWSELQVAPCKTHHFVKGRAAYAARFRWVGKFHKPGLAPVLGTDGAHHIRADATPAYAVRFRRTFGFYEGRASVNLGECWCIIDENGLAVGVQRFAWAGNFQDGRCTVRHLHGGYGYVDRDGQSLGQQDWSYAGDSRNGVSVVQRQDGLHSHIDRQGHLVHRRWFRDLDVFHKGYARARDKRGWCHVDRNGRAVYHQRFAMVEPFYNGQARVENSDGALLVIDEEGCIVNRLRVPVDAAP